MAASMPTDFDSWLSGKLKSLNTDENVFGSYITGILEGEESQEEKIEALEGILTEIIPEDGESLTDICQDIFYHWNEVFPCGERNDDSKTVDVDTQIAKIMEQQAQIVVPQKQYTEEEKKLRQTILAQYAEISDGEEEEEEEVAGATAETAGGILLSRNTNAEEVSKAEWAKKEKLRQDAQKKKEKDKEDREKQKQLQQERKDKEKKRTQKAERKR